LLGRLAALGYGPDKVVPLAFHVDYFNDPWKDPFSEPALSQRELAYNEALGRKDLYFTPMMMIDGRHPMLGTDRPKALAALKEALKEHPGVSLAIDLSGGPESPRRKTLKATLTAAGDGATGRALLVGAAIVENPTVTDVPAGENAGKTLVEPFTVRTFVYQKVTLDPARPSELTFPLELPANAEARRSGVALFVQDWLKGNVYQADAVAWTSGPEEAAGAAPKKGSKRAGRSKAR
jgi:hypothetical protein